jgi:hypothetical protein
LNVARKQEKLPPEFWDSYQKLNEALATFAHAPQVDLHELEDGKRVSWNLITEDNRISYFPCASQMVGATDRAGGNSQNTQMHAMRVSG